MKDRKALRAQRHLSQVKTVDRSVSEQHRDKSEGFEQTNKGLKKTIIYHGAKYLVDMVKE